MYICSNAQQLLDNCASPPSDPLEFRSTFVQACGSTFFSFITARHTHLVLSALNAPFPPQGIFLRTFRRLDSTFSVNFSTRYVQNLSPSCPLKAISMKNRIFLRAHKKVTPVKMKTYFMQQLSERIVSPASSFCCSRSNWSNSVLPFFLLCRASCVCMDGADGVYPASEDSFLLIDVLTSELSTLNERLPPQPKCVEIGYVPALPNATRMYFLCLVMGCLPYPINEIFSHLNMILR